MAIDFYALLRKRIPGLEDLSASSRGGLYRKIVAGAEGIIANAEPPLTVTAAAEIRNSLDEAVKKIEAEFAEVRRVGSGYAPDWALPPKPAPAADTSAPAANDSAPPPKDTDATDRPPPAVTVPATIDPVKPEPDIESPQAFEPASRDDWDEPVDLRALEQRLALPATQFGRVLSYFSDHVRIVGAILRHMIKTAAGTERIAYLWLALEPLMQVGLVVSLYWLFGRTIVYGMPAVPFAIIGVGGWLIFRTLLTRVATGLGREFAMCYFPTVTRFDVFLSRALFFGLTYSFASFVMLACAYYFDFGGVPINDSLTFAFYWLLVWIFSIGFALSMNYLFVLVPTIRRLLLVILRGLYLFSAVVVVTEQLSAEDKVIFLWNPLVHGMQLLRSAYFVEYKSEDANPAFFLVCTLGLFLFGLICERAQRRMEITP